MADQEAAVLPRPAAMQPPAAPARPDALPGPYTTQLAADEEPKFQSWVKQNNIPWQDDPKADYDMRGYWKAQQSGDPNAKRAENLHFPDTYKTPYHQSFSNESKYALPVAPHWDGNKLKDHKGGVVFDEDAPKSQPKKTSEGAVPSLYDGLKVRVADAAQGVAAATGITAGVHVAENLGHEIKDIATDPEKRRNFVTGTLVGMASGTGDGEIPDVPEIYKNLRVRKASEVMVQPHENSMAAQTGAGGSLPPELHADLEKQAGRSLTPEEAVALDRANLERGMVTAPKGDTNAIREAKRSQLEKPREEPKSVAKNASGESSASQEAINRAASEKLSGTKRIRIDTRSGKEYPLLPGVDAVDQKPGPWDKIITRDGKGKETLLDKGEKVPKSFKQAASDNMNDPDTRFSAARHESGHSVISEMLNPGSVEGSSLSAKGGDTEIAPAAGKEKISDLSHDDIKDFIATSLAGGLSEPGGTTPKHASGDMAARAKIIGALSSTPMQNLERLATGKAKDDEMLRAPQVQAEAHAKVAAMLSDPRTQRAIDGLAGKLNGATSLSGVQIRKFLSNLK